MKILVSILLIIILLLLIISFNYLNPIMLFIYGYESNILDVHSVQSVKVTRYIYPGKILYGLSTLVFSCVCVWYSGRLKKDHSKSEVLKLLHIIHILLLTGLIFYLVVSFLVGRMSGVLG